MTVTVTVTSYNIALVSGLILHYVVYVYLVVLWIVTVTVTVTVIVTFTVTVAVYTMQTRHTPTHPRTLNSAIALYKGCISHM